MPRSFLVKTTKRREDQGEGERGADNFGKWNEFILYEGLIFKYGYFVDRLFKPFAYVQR